MQQFSDKRVSWLALRMIQGIGNIVFKHLLETFGSPDRVFQASFSELMAVDGVRKEVAQHIVSQRLSGDPIKEIEAVEAHGARILLYTDLAYPSILKEIYSPPMVLSIKGNDIPRTLSHVAVVGSRNATHYGLSAAEMIGQGIARRGFGVVSGMARGIDAAAHWGCINGRGFPVAVIGTGIDIVYPASNTNLFDSILKNGAVISEFPLGTPPIPAHFPMRNRIISGLSKGVVIVEATKQSGSLITASLALEQGREVFAVPGSINSFKSTGCHFLIKQGATLVETADDILDSLGFSIPHLPKRDTFKEQVPLSFDNSEQGVYNVIGDYPVHIDEIARQCGLKSGEASGILMRMELKGLIKQLPGKRFVR